MKPNAEMKTLYLGKGMIMSTAQIRELLHEYINQADERFIQLVYGMIQADKSKGYLLSESEEEELEKRKDRHKTGASKSYSWEEIKQGLQDR